MNFPLSPAEIVRASPPVPRGVAASRRQPESDREGAYPITATITGFSRIAGIGRSRIYELIDSGDLESVLIGKRRLVIVDSWRRLIARKQAEGGKRPRQGGRT